jgi:fucose permease
VVALWIGTFILGFSLASVFPTTLALAGRHMTITGQVTGWFFIGAGIGSMALPWLIGQAFNPLGPGAFLWLLGADLLVALLVLWALLAVFRFSEGPGLHPNP